jgi:hypothetical protein
MTRASFQGKTSENDLASINEMAWSVGRTAQVQLPTYTARTAVAPTACRFHPDRRLHRHRRHDKWRTGRRYLRLDPLPPEQRLFRLTTAGARAHRPPPWQSMAASVAEFWPVATRNTSQVLPTTVLAAAEGQALVQVAALNGRCDALATPALSKLPERTSPYGFRGRPPAPGKATQRLHQSSSPPRATSRLIVRRLARDIRPPRSPVASCEAARCMRTQAKLRSDEMILDDQCVEDQPSELVDKVNTSCFQALRGAYRLQPKTGPEFCNFFFARPLREDPRFLARDCPCGGGHFHSHPGGRSKGGQASLAGLPRLPSSGKVEDGGALRLAALLLRRLTEGDRVVCPSIRPHRGSPVVPGTGCRSIKRSLPTKL